MVTNEVVKRNISGMQVIKTLQLLLEGNYTMSELTQKLNENEKEPIFNNSVVSKYINTCRYCGIEIPKIHNKYFVSKLPFGLNLTTKDLDVLDKIQQVAAKNFSNKSLKNFESFILKLNQFSNKDIIKVEKKTFDLTFEYFAKAIQENRRVRLMYRAKAIVDCIPLSIVEYRGKKCFKVLHEEKIKCISVERISGLEVLGKIYEPEERIGQEVTFKLTGDLISRYTLREHEEVSSNNLPDSITITNIGEDKKELLSRLLRYDKNCEVLTPQCYRDEMKTMLDSMLSNYEV